MKIRITGKGPKAALIDPYTGQKVFVSGRDNNSDTDHNKGLLEAIL